MREFWAKLALNLYFLIAKGDTEMMAMLFAQRVILGKTEFDAVPAKLKAQVACPTGITYTYNLTAKKWATFPLSEGDGEYKVTVHTNMSGNSYATVGSQSFKVELDDSRSPFLMANQFVDYTSSTTCVKKASSLCKNVSGEMKKVKKV